MNELVEDASPLTPFVKRHLNSPLFVPFEAFDLLIAVDILALKLPPFVERSVSIGEAAASMLLLLLLPFVPLMCKMRRGVVFVLLRLLVLLLMMLLAVR